MTIRTIITIGTNYPDNIHIAAGGNDDKWVGYIYLFEEDEIDRLLIDTSPIFESEEAATNRMVELCEWCVDYLKDNEVFDIE